MFSKTVFIFFIVNFVSDLYGQRGKKFFRNDYTYIDSVESFYKIYPTPQNWTEALRSCALEGAAMWHPDNEKELLAVVEIWKRDKPLYEYVFTSLTDILVEGQFETIDGKKSTEVYLNWNFNEPNDAFGDEDCTHMNWKGEMNDAGCFRKSHFICKKTLQSLEWNHVCDIPDLDYTINKKTGKCYKFHTTPLPWTDANAVCQLEQSTLAVINNQEEADYLVKLAISTPKSRIKGKYQRGIYHLGFHNRFNQSQGWQTIKGTPLKVEPEAWYDNHEPYEDFGECGAMFFDGHLVNIDCDVRCLFICEHGVANVASDTVELTASQPYFGGGV